MNLQKLATVVGAAVTTFLVVGAATIEAVMAATGADVGPGIVGVFVGVLFGLAAGVAVQLRWEAFQPAVRVAVLGYGAFGLTLVFLAFLSYVNAPGVDEYLGFQRNLVVAAVVALAVALGRWRLTRTSAAA